MIKILVPTDFSPVANNAVQYAVSLSEILKAELVVYHADQENDESLTTLKKEVSKTIYTGTQLSISYILSHKLFNSTTVNEVIKDNDISLIVMGTTGEDASLKKKLFGRNTVEIARHINCPIIVVPPGYKFSGIKRIAYSSDLNFIDKEIDAVIGLAKTLNSSIEIFHVSPVFPDLGDVEKMNMKQKLEGLKQKYAFNAIQYSVEKTNNDNQIVKGITSFINHYNADLLVMYHNHVSLFDEFLSGSTTAEIISTIKTPLLIYPKVLPQH